MLSISFASPGIATEWGIDRAALGVVLSMELIGMAIGSILLGGVADTIGRKPTVIGCLVVMATGMLMATTATSIVTLSAWRIVTGLGIGGMLAAINAVAAEFSNTRRRHLSVSLMSIGYPVGAVLGGLVAAQLLRATTGGRSSTSAPRSRRRSSRSSSSWCPSRCTGWRASSQRVRCEKINASLVRMGHAAVAALPTIGQNDRKGSAADIFAPALIATTMIVTLAYFFHITTFYFILKWIPKIVVDMGFAPSSAAGVLVWTNVGGATGGAIFGLLTQRYRVVPLTIGILLLSSATVTMFGRSPADLQQLSFYSFLGGFTTNAGIVGLYAIIAQAFPTHVRASGTGFAIGVGRGGSVIAPILAGVLFTAGYSLPTTAMVLAVGSLLGAGMLFMLKLEGDRIVEAPRPSRPSTVGRA